MTHHLSKLLLVVTLALGTPLSARDNYSIRHALAKQDYGSALALTRHEFASVRSGGEAANLIRSTIALAPAAQIPPLVTPEDARGQWSSSYGALDLTWPEIPAF
jgi:hypothetical protein